MVLEFGDPWTSWINSIVLMLRWVGIIMSLDCGLKKTASISSVYLFFLSFALRVEKCTLPTLLTACLHARNTLLSPHTHTSAHYSLGILIPI